MIRPAHKGQTATAGIEEVRAVLFDLDGTLIDTVNLIRTSMRHATQAVLGADLTDDELMRNVGIPLRAQMARFSAEKADELVTAYREHNAIVHDDLIAGYDGVAETLARLRERELPLGIVTSKSRPVALRGMELFDLAGYFDVIVCSDDVAQHKPDPHPLLFAAERIGMQIERCAYVGDSPHDMTAAVAAGAVAVAALWGAFERDVVLGPGADYAIEDVRQVVELLDGTGERFRVHAEAENSTPTGTQDG